MSDYPFRCKNCEKIHYSQNILVEPKCCENAGMDRLVSVCLLIPAKEGQVPIHTTQRSDLANHETKWVLACGATVLPSNFTDYPPACSCKKCREYVESLYQKAGWSLDEAQKANLQDDSVSVHLEPESPPNPFQ